MLGATRSWFTNAELVLRVNRFEVLAACLLTSGLAIAAILTNARLTAIVAPADCFRRWIASVPVDPVCEAAVGAWARLSDGDVGNVMVGMTIVPVAVGVLLGVPLVAREIEVGTASLAWALAGSRSKWLTRVVLPFGIAFLLALVVDALAATALADTRSAGNVWSSTFADANLFGGPAVLRGVLGFAVGVGTGALVGRLLPAILLALALSFGSLAAIGALQPWVVQSTYQMVDIGAPGANRAFLEHNPDVDVFFVTTDQRIVAPEDARREAPPGTADPLAWLADNARLVPLGASRAATARWQFVASAILAFASGVVLLVALQIVRRRAPL